ncbi:MAG: hypothetical protein MUQ27_09045 [Acidimicrobiia bacterium]|nr:hypothetical protein [Acidimicrobiia bacterium]
MDTEATLPRATQIRLQLMMWVEWHAPFGALMDALLWAGGLGSGRRRRISVHVLGMLRGPGTTNNTLNNFFHLTRNPWRVGEDSPFLAGVELGLEVGTHPFALGDGDPVGRHFRTVGEFLPARIGVRSGARPCGQRLLDRDKFRVPIEDEVMDVGDLFGGLNVVSGIFDRNPDLLRLFENRLEVLRREVGDLFRFDGELFTLLACADLDGVDALGVLG